jgi:hypothetical protein
MSIGNVKRRFKMSKQIKIFADFMNSDKKGRIRLTTNGTRKDLLDNNIELREGMELWIDDREGHSVICIVEFSKEENIWVGVIDRVK